MALGKNSPDRDTSFSEPPTIVDNNKILDNINLSSYMRFRLFERLTIPSDRSIGLLSGNVLGMLDSNKKYLRLDFDFDRSLFVGKFKIDSYSLQEDGSKSLSENFKDQFNKLCVLDSSPKSKNYEANNYEFYLTLDVKTKACKEVMNQIKNDQLDKKVLDLINNFTYLNDEQKKNILERSTVFFDVLSKIQLN